MKKYLVKYKPFLLFLAKFLLTYLVLAFCYQLYLGSFNEVVFEVDGFTRMVAVQTEKLLLLFNADASVIPHLNEPSMKLFYNHEYVARVVEGCNGLSVIILFASFVVAFTGRLRHTVLFIVSGSLLIYVLNVGRIALLAYFLYYYPEQEHLLHGVLFPLCIYGVVFLLWIVWVNKYSLYAGKTV